MAPVRESWTRIVDWLGRSAPVTAAQIGAPATPESVSEVERIVGRINERGLTLVPTRIYFKDGRAKVELGLGPTS